MPQLDHILVFDLETTDLDITKAQPCQFCGHLYKELPDGGFEKLRTVDHYIKIDGLMPTGAKAIHGIDNQQLEAYGETRGHSANLFTTFKAYQPLILMGYNIIAYDIPIWFNFVKKHSVLKYPFPVIYQVIDVLAMIVALRPNEKWPKLGEACSIFGVDYNPSELHNASYDVMKTWQVYIRLMEVLTCE